jgi:hypothetical protein
VTDYKFQLRKQHRFLKHRGLLANRIVVQNDRTYFISRVKSYSPCSCKIAENRGSRRTLVFGASDTKFSEWHRTSLIQIPNHPFNLTSTLIDILHIHKKIWNRASFFTSWIPRNGYVRRGWLPEPGPWQTDRG